LGVALLLFSLGLEFSWRRLKSLGRIPLLGGGLQVGLTACAGAAVAAAMGLDAKQAVAVGAIVSLSSTAVVLRILMERGDIDSAHGRNSLAALLIQDIAVVPLALLMTFLGTGGDWSEAIAQIGQTLALAALLLVGLYLAVNHVAVYAMGTLTLERNRELTIVLAVVVGIGSAWAAHTFGISPALGAFAAGMFLGGSPFATQIRADVASLRVVLLTLFFGAAGMVADPLWILQNLHVVLGATVLLVLGKVLVVWPIYQFLGQSATVAIATGLCLAQIGEFAFVLAAIGQANGALSAETNRLIVSVTIATLLLSPYLVPNAQHLAALCSGVLPARWRSGMAPGAPPDRFRPHVVIIGFGPAGQVAVQPFCGRTSRVLVVDLNRAGIRAARNMGLETVLGDATQREVLEHAHVQAAKVVVITIPHFESAMTILGQVRRLAPNAHLVVRSRYLQQTVDYVNAGADVAIGDEEEMGKSLGRHIQQWLASVEHSDTHRSMVQQRAIREE
jgi:CPA2 family monovalent cation:H+ antiporter-2